MQNMEVARYSCSQQELYTIARNGWKNYGKRLSDFMAFKPRYTQAYRTDRLAEIDAVQKMQTNNASSGTSVKSHIELGAGAAECLLKWQMLKRYMADTYSGPVADAMLKAAGQPNYTSASSNNWASVATLMNEGSTFIGNHVNELLANDNMPPDFAATFDATKDAYTNLYDQFLEDTNNSTASGQKRLKANNAIFDKLSTMLQDGQLIFAKDDGVKQQFIFTSIKSMITGVTQAGLRGVVTDASTGLSITTAIVATANNIYTATADDTGRYDLLNLAADDYVLTISAVGYIAQTVQVTVKTGTVSTLNVSLVAEVVN